MLLKTSWALTLQTFAFLFNFKHASSPDERNDWTNEKDGQLEASPSSNKFFTRAAAVMRNDPCTRQWQQVGRKESEEWNTFREIPSGAILKNSCTLFYSPPVLFSLIYYKSHKFHLSLRGLIYLWWGGQCNKHVYSVISEGNLEYFCSILFDFYHHSFVP